MKRCLPFLLGILLLLSACGRQVYESALGEANANCDTPLYLGMPETEAEKQTSDVRTGIWGGWSLENEDVRYTFSGYPDASDAYHLTEIELLSEKYHVFGITIHDDLQTALSRLESFGYQKDAGQSAAYGAAVWAKGDVQLLIYAAAGTICGIRLRVITTNTENINF